mgnify:FL=1|tara:strand:+ start:244 stop:1062 length:819 start_codon:yes stop_codon:yes gene_type:complete
MASKKKAAKKVGKAVEALTGDALKRERTRSLIASRQAREKKEAKKPTQKNLSDKRIELEGARVDPDTNGSVDVGRLVGTKGEKVSTGAGTRAMSIVKEQTTAGHMSVAKKYNAIAKKIDDKTATPAERKWFMKQAYKDADAFTRQKGQSIKSKQAASLARKMKAAGGVDNYRTLLDYGVVSDNMTINQIETAIRNVKARANLKKGTSMRAVMEALKEKATQPKLARGKPLGKPRGHGGPELVAPKKPRKRKLSRGGLTKAGHKDYRKGGMFY